uniref:Uncharacterized protein n=1 Tax=viral metagenome TaxID=1070528 RepID=A0A6C0IHC1_9ZZZZ
MYSNSSFNVHNAKPLIPRDQNYVIDRKLVSIHSEDRDITKYPNGNQFAITLPQPLLNVQSMRLVQSTFPVVQAYYTFSNEYQNTRFRFSVLLIGGTTYTPYCVKIQEGTYNPCQLALEITNVMNNAVGTEIFNVFYDVVGSKFWFGSTGLLFTLDFNYKMEYPGINCNQPIVFYNYARWGFPYYIGYEKIQYVADGSVPIPPINYIPAVSGDPIIVIAPIPHNVINIGGEKDIYMEVDKYNSYDELYPYTESNKNAYDNNAYSGKVNSAFAKIPLDFTLNQDSRNLLLINFVQYEPPLERIAKLVFRFRFHDGLLVDFRGLEFNFTIEFNSLRNEIALNRNIRTPAMISL